MKQKENLAEREALIILDINLELDVTKSLLYAITDIYSTTAFPEFRQEHSLIYHI